MKGKHLVSLEDFNLQRRAEYRTRENKTARPNGIACPECGHELVDTNPTTVLTSNPPRLNVQCVECGFRDYRFL